MMDDDQCGAIGGMSASETAILAEILPKDHFIHHKTHIT
jgi:hypothetical protein